MRRSPRVTALFICRLSYSAGKARRSHVGSGLPRWEVLERPREQRAASGLPPAPSLPTVGRSAVFSVETFEGAIAPFVPPWGWRAELTVVGKGMEGLALISSPWEHRCTRASVGTGEALDPLCVWSAAPHPAPPCSRDRLQTWGLGVGSWGGGGQDDFMTQ